ncbi:MAG: hypothetical protein K2L49_02595 [Muribaculaceae bacterium]|nr:hypothetical protein [Muribaculaceae bacterium]
MAGHTRISPASIVGLILMMLTAGGISPINARTINVRGTVIQQGSREPIEGVAIYNAVTDRLIGTTNMEGKYTVSIDDEGTLLFSILGSQDLTEPVNGRLAIDVALFPEAKELEEVVITAKGAVKGLVIEPAELDLKGNYIYLKKHVKIPHKIFASDVRMIIQPGIYNVTRRSLTYLAPVVFAGFRYAITQKRMYDWKPETDPLSPYVQVKSTGRSKDDIVLISDSLYVDNPKDDFMCVVMASMENYNRVIYADTFQIARGTVNPLRFLEYDLKGAELTDPRYLPQPEVHLRDQSGDVNLSFPLGKTRLDMSMGNNASEMETMLSEIRAIENDPDMTLKSFSIYGTASPEGRYEFNKQLADGRMQSAMDVILGAMPESMRRNAEISSGADVASWEDVEALLRADGLDSEADAVRAVIRRYPRDISQQSYRMRSLPFYKTTLLNDYLPRLRRVSYRIVSSRYRPLTDEEIAQLYMSDRANLSKYHFWRHYKNAADQSSRENIMREALTVHPDFLAAATDLSALLIDRREADEEILAPFFTDINKIERLPEESRYDMAVAAMQASHFNRADSLLSQLPDTPAFHDAKVYCAALSGRYNEVIEEISAISPFNEVLLLLATKNNGLAWQKAQKLGGSAREEYVKAIAANRVDEYLNAIVHLENALALDPTLRDLARIDGDVYDLLEEEDQSSTNPSNEQEGNNNE